MNDSALYPPSLLLLFGPPAVGKMTVGQELERLAGFRLFHIHQVIDLSTQYFPFNSSPDSAYIRLVVAYRRLFFEEAARTGLQVVTTDAWRFPSVAEAAVRSYMQPFLERDGQVYVVELTASLETRLARNLTENRRRSKQVDWSTEEYLRADDQPASYRRDVALPFDVPYLRLETDELSAEETAERICAHFGLPKVIVP